MPDLRIALVAESTRPRGTVVHALSLAEALARAGQQVSVWAPAEAGDQAFFRPVDSAVRVHVVAVPPPKDAGEDTDSAEVRRRIAALSAAFSAAGTGYDIVHAVDWIGANAVPGRLRTVHHLEDFTVPELAAAHDRGLLEPCAHICVSAAVAAELVTGWGRAAEVIGTGVDAERFTAAAGTDPDATEGRRYWTDRFGDFVLAVGGIEPRKGTVELVRAMARVRRRRPGTRLVIAGGDTRLGFWEYRRDVDGLAARLRIEPEILGPVPQAQLPSLVAAARVFAFGSIRAGSGLAAMEALAAGVPVVTRDLPEFREVFEDTVGFAEIGDGSSADVAAGLATRLVAALEGAPEPTGRDDGIALAARHNWDDAAAAHVALYHRLIAAGLPVGMAPAVR